MPYSQLFTAPPPEYFFAERHASMNVVCTRSSISCGLAAQQARDQAMHREVVAIEQRAERRAVADAARREQRLVGDLGDRDAALVEPAQRHDLTALGCGIAGFDFVLSSGPPAQPDAELERADRFAGQRELFRRNAKRRWRARRRVVAIAVCANGDSITDADAVEPQVIRDRDRDAHRRRPRAASPSRRAGDRRGRSCTRAPDRARCTPGSPPAVHAPRSCRIAGLDGGGSRRRRGSSSRPTPRPSSGTIAYAADMLLVARGREHREVAARGGGLARRARLASRSGRARRSTTRRTARTRRPRCRSSACRRTSTPDRTRPRPRMPMPARRLRRHLDRASDRSGFAVTIGALASCGRRTAGRRNRPAATNRSTSRRPPDR